MCEELAKTNAEEGCETAKARGTMCAEKRDCVRRGCERRIEFYPKTAVCEKQQGDGCHEGPFARRLRKGESWQQAAMCEGAAERGETAEGCETRDVLVAR